MSICSRVISMAMCVRGRWGQYRYAPGIGKAYISYVAI
ncbi:protein of unknown function [Cupriavidus taiwanensis]|nr:protein of unknown function [Cupriavidus taiwanensis]SOZ04271.1 hypothetical protein CBM2597_A50384 [Cupriavidus taiwanensis]SPD38705.1 protein of unknown function [Cupriavidus taiwanensis]